MRVRKTGEKKSGRRGRPRGSYDREARDAASRVARLARAGFGQRAAARIVDAAERRGRAVPEDLLVAGEARQRQRFVEARRRGTLARPSTEERLLREPQVCSCGDYPTEHAHCAGCDMPIDAAAKLCDRPACYRAVYWGDPETAHAAREAALRERRSASASARPPGPHRRTRPQPEHVTCSYCGAEITSSRWTCSHCGETYYACPTCEPGELDAIANDHPEVCACPQ